MYCIYLPILCILELERLEREMAKKRPLSVKDIDLNILKNSQAHHTDKYELTQLTEDKRELVVRRGQEFEIILILDQEYDKGRHDLALNFKTGKGTRQTKARSAGAQLQNR
jgi:hypothetical protein